MTGARQCHLILAVDGRPMMHGWWAAEKTAREKFTSWVGERGAVPGARITLADDTTGQELMTWPQED
ncbi:hypothetical protein ACIRQQ_00220 [Streptomyces fuscichromogenes]|uniref:hypothetical protein n=1 Tax=Streptomyces fuscichromogenes TaxID=1324013 RepID=UPI0037F57CCB